MTEAVHAKCLTCTSMWATAPKTRSAPVVGPQYNVRIVLSAMPVAGSAAGRRWAQVTSAQ